MHSDFDEFRLTAWPELDASFDQVAHTRLVTSLSNKYRTIPELRESSGLSRDDVRALLRALEANGVLETRTVPRGQSHDLFAPIGPQLLAAVRKMQDAYRSRWK